MIYCISDIHGCYDELIELLRIIEFNRDDTLYILGDAIDRGDAPMACLKYIMDAPNVHMLMGNHEQMMIDALTSDFNGNPGHMINWLENGGAETLLGFHNLPKEEQIKIIDFLLNLPYINQVKKGEQNYVLVHAGLNVVDARISGHVSSAAILPRQQLKDMVWIREKFYKKKALPNSITVFGHTPIPMIKKRINGRVWRDEKYNDKIGIDGGCVYGGSLLALRLDDMAEFAVGKK